jgi:hypothetical protein
VQSQVEIPEWQRWNDYGIGLLLELQSGGRENCGKLRAFKQVSAGPLTATNLARVYNAEPLDEAVEAIGRATKFKDPPAPPWTIAWLSGLLNRQQGYLEAAEKNFRSVLEDHTPAMRERRFDFSLDYEVINELGSTLFERAKQQYGPERQLARQSLLQQAVAKFERTIELDPENVPRFACICCGQLGDASRPSGTACTSGTSWMTTRDHAVAARKSGGEPRRRSMIAAPAARGWPQRPMTRSRPRFAAGLVGRSAPARAPDPPARSLPTSPKRDHQVSRIPEPSVALSAVGDITFSTEVRDPPFANSEGPQSIGQDSSTS